MGDIPKVENKDEECLIQLDNELKDMISKISLKFTFEDKLSIDFMDLFPVLKEGRCNIKTLYGIMFQFFSYVNRYEIKNNIFPENVRDNFFTNNQLSHDNTINFIKSHIKIINDGIIDERINKELILVNDLHHVFRKVLDNKIHSRTLKHILVVLCMYKGAIYEELSDNVSLLCSTLKRDKTAIIEKLMIDEINPIYLYEFAKTSYVHQRCNEITILNIIKTATIKRNWLEKEAINNMFGELSNDIFQHIIKFR